MKVFESTITDSVEVQGGEWDKVIVHYDSKYSISLSNWVLVMIVFVVIVLNWEIIILLLQKYVLADCTGWPVVSRENMNSKQITQNYSEERGMMKEHEIVKMNENTPIGRVGIPQSDAHSWRMQINKANEFSESFKYLCTCIPGNRIEARKPIKSFQSMYGNH